MKEQELNELLDKAIGEKGNLRIPSFWMKKIFKGLMEWCKTLTPKIPYVPTRVSEFENDVPYAIEPLVYDKSSSYIPRLEPNGVTIISNRTGNFEFELDNIEDTYSYYVLQLNEFEGSITFNNVMIHWDKPLPQQFDKYTKYLITLKSVNGYNFFGTYIVSPVVYEFKINFTSEEDEVRPLYNPDVSILSMNIDGEEMEPTQSFQFTAGTHEVIIRTNSTNRLFRTINGNTSAKIWPIDSLELPIGLTKLEEFFLSGSFSINGTLVIPDSVKEMERYALQDDVQSIYIPQITKVDSAITCCYGLRADNLLGPLVSDDGHYVVTSDGSLLCMKGYDSDTYVTIPDNIKYLNTSVIDYDYITGIDFNNAECFYGGSSNSASWLKSISFGKNTRIIGDKAFKGKTQLQKIYCEALTPPTIKSTTFEGCSKLSYIYVPSQSIDLYKQAPYWSDFANKMFGRNFS